MALGNPNISPVDITLDSLYNGNPIILECTRKSNSQKKNRFVEE